MNETQARAFYASPQGATFNSLTKSLKLVSNRSFIVASINEEGLFSVAPSPAEHPSLESAQLECDRLAKLKPGTSYVAMKLSGGSMVPRVTGVGRF